MTWPPYSTATAWNRVSHDTDSGSLLIAVALAGCDTNVVPPFVTGLPGDPARLESYLSTNQLQEAAWECAKLEQDDREDSILVVLRETLESKPVEIERWGGKGIMTNYLLTFPNGVKGFFKVAGSDSWGRSGMKWQPTRSTICSGSS